MTFKKLTVHGPSKDFDDARARMISAKDDPNDPMSYNVAFALNAYFRAVIGLEGELIDGLNQLLEKVDGIEKKLNISSRP